MAKFRKAFAGVPAGEIYPVEYVKGDDCPPELLDAAIDVGAVKAPKTVPTPDTDPAEEDDAGDVDAEAEADDVSDGVSDDVVIEDGAA